jgi:asparagine synthase (glutamine-hydrolysing)
MCGIAGILMPGRRPFERPAAEAIVRKMMGTIHHRGPDGDGLWSDDQGRCVIGQQRLAIIDTSTAGLQPFASSDGRWWITFNGEIYNFQEVRPDLARAGIKLRGRTDTEVLIESLALWGTDALPRLDGMFAFAAFDTRTGETLLARDPFGEKPLYYMRLDGGGLAFASELQALEGVPGFDNDISLDSVAEVLSFQYIGAPRTIFKNVYKLPPGHWMRLRADGTSETNRYFQFAPGRNLYTGRSIKDLADELEDILVRSLDRRMIADVPLGAFLSGGVDSSTTCALIRRKLSRPLKTYSIGFRGAAESEHDIARKFAEHLGTEHHEELLEPQGAEFLHGIGALLDEPNADSSCFPTYLLSRFARQHVTVAISGDGGDEMFGGYGRYFATLSEAQQGGRNLGRSYYGERILVANETHISELLGFVPEGFATHLAGLREEIREGNAGVLASMRRSDVDNYMPGAVLPKVDRMSMQHSLEVRTPFLNVELARFAERLPPEMLVRHGRGKLILREIAYRYLPRNLIDLPKQGFGLPMSDWARTSLLNVASELLESDESRLAEGIGRSGIDQFLARHRSPGGFSTYQVWAVAMLEAWLRKHPVRWEPLGDRRTSTKKPDSLRAFHVGANTWIVTRNAASFEQAQKSLSPQMLTMVLDDIVSAPVGARSSKPDLVLPDWSEKFTKADVARLKSLEGGRLYFADSKEMRDLGYSAFGRFLRLGVSQVSIHSRHFDHQIDVFKVQRSLFGLPRIRRLWKKRLFTAVPEGARVFGLPDDLPQIKRQENHRYLVRVCDGFLGKPDQEMSSQFAVFEGLRQLPPTHVSHAEIGCLGNGRYSIFNGELYLSPTEATGLRRFPYWIVPVTPDTSKDLSIVSVAQAPVDPKGALNEYFTDRDGDGFVLNPGDPVVVFTHALPPGGAERQWVLLAKGLKDAGYEVTFVTFQPLVGENAHYLPILRKRGIPIVSACEWDLRGVARDIPVIHNYARLTEDLPFERLQTIAALNTVKPKAIFAQLDGPNIIAGVAGRILGVQRIVVSFRNYNPTNFPYIYQSSFLPNYRLLARSSAIRFTGNFRGASDDYADWIGIDRSRVHTIPNAFDASQFSAPSEQEIQDLRDELGLSPQEAVILGVFRLSEEKDPFGFIEVIKDVAGKIGSVKALIAGVGPLQPQLEARVQEWGLERNITFLGRRGDVNALMAIADLLLLTSTNEGMPNVVVEAQMMGTPVVATDTGATSDIVVDGATGFVRPVGDYASLAEMCIGLLSDRNKALEMGRKARANVIDRFPVQKLAANYVAALR